MSCYITIDMNVNKALSELKDYCSTNISQFIAYLTIAVEELKPNGTLTFTEKFKEFRKRNAGLDANASNPTVVKNAIIDYFNHYFPDTSEGVKNLQALAKVKKFGYKSVLAREEAKQFYAQQISRAFSNVVNKGKTKGKHNTAYYVREAKLIVLKSLARRLSKIITNKTEDEIKIDLNKGKVNELIAPYADILPRTIENFVALAREITLKDEKGNEYLADFIDEVSLDKTVMAIIDVTEKGEEIIEDINKNDEAQGDNPESTDYDPKTDTVDDWIQRLNNKLGLHTDFMTHVDAPIRALLTTVPKKKTDETQIINGKPAVVVDQDNELGVTTYMSPEFISAVLYNYGRFENRDEMMKSILKISETLNGCEGFSSLYDVLHDDIELQMRFFRVFSRTVISKVELVQSNGYAYFRISNEKINRADLLKSRYLDSIKSSALDRDYDTDKNVQDLLSKRVNDLTKKEPTYTDIRDLAIEIAKELKNYYTTIEELDCVSYVFHNRNLESYKNDTERYISNLNSLLASLLDTIKGAEATETNYQQKQVRIGILRQHNSKLKKAGKVNEIVDLSPIYYEPYISNKSASAAAQLATKLESYTIFGLKLNTRNVLGNQASDVINNSMITSIKEILESKGNVSREIKINNVTQTVYDKNSPIFRLAEQRFRNGENNQYELSNILIEHKDENGKIINYGLFYLDDDGAYKPTKYATTLLKFPLFNGASNLDEGTAALYNQMSKTDYLGTAWKGFFRSTNLTSFGGSSADYLFRIPSDAPKNFVLSAPTYSANGLYSIANKAEINKQIYDDILEPLFNEERGKEVSKIIKEEKVFAKNKPIVIYEKSRWLDKEDFVRHLISGVTSTTLPNLGKPTKIKIPPHYLQEFKNAKIGKDDRIYVMFRFKLTEQDNAGDKRYIMEGRYSNGELQDARCVGIEYSNLEAWDADDTMRDLIRNTYWNILKKMSSTESGIDRKIDTTHTIFRQLRNAFVQELKDRAVAANVIFEYDADKQCAKTVPDTKKTKGRRRTSITEQGITKYVPVFRDGITNTNHNGLFQWYHFADDKDDGHGAIYTIDNNGYIHLTGKVFGSDRFILYDYFADEKYNKAKENAQEGEKVEGPVFVRNYGNEIMQHFRIFDEYGVSEEDRLHFDENGNITELTNTQNEVIDKMISDFIIDTLENSKNRLLENEDIFEIEKQDAENNKVLSDDIDTNILSFALNYHLAYLMCNDLFEGDTKFYKNVQTFLKRAKETQGSGVPLGITDWTAPIEPHYDELIASKLDSTDFFHIDSNGNKTPFEVKLHRGFRGLTVFNTVLTNTRVLETFKKVLTDKKIMGNAALREEDALTLLYGAYKEKKGKRDGGYQDSCINDAQSYITFKEFIRRVAAKGELAKYKDLFDRILDESKELDIKDLQAFIQVQKNFYYDQHYNPLCRRNGPRQIKNAEFVLVPRLIKGTELEVVANIMDMLEIDQLNTSETSKAAQSYRFTLWDETGNISDNVLKDVENYGVEGYEYKSELFKLVKSPERRGVEIFNYNFLYVQQETHQHMFDKNKAGIQVVKKLIDNIHKDISPKHLYDLKEEFLNLFAACVKDSYKNLMQRFNVVLDEDGNIRLDDNGNIPVVETDDDGNITKKGIDYTEFFSALRRELVRLGADSNLVDYCTPDPHSRRPAGTVMPNYMTLVGAKFENIVQSLFNHSITRQTLPGFHAAQVSGIGTRYNIKDKTLREILNKKATSNDLYYHPKIFKHVKTGEKLSEGELDRRLEKGTITKEEYNQYKDTGEISPYIEIRVPVTAFGFDRSKYKGKSKEEQNAEFLKQLQEIHADVILGYRIPTEGKQSLALMKVVDFCDDAYGSTIFLPDAWVTQTGADFDIDSVYSIMHSLYFDSNGRIKRRDYYNKEDIRKQAKYLWFDYIYREIGFRADGVTKKRYEKIIGTKEQELSDLEKSRNRLKEKEQNAWKELPKNVKKEIKKVHEHFKDMYGGELSRLEYADQIEDELKVLADFNTTPEIENYGSILEDIKKLLTGDDKARIYGKASEEFETIRREQLGKYISKVNSYNDGRKKEDQLMSLDDYTQWALNNVEEANSQGGRINRLVDVMIKIAEDPLTWEEHFSRSNFDDVTDAIDTFTVGFNALQRSARSAYSIFSQAEFMEDAMSGAKLKAFSVVRDTFCSICNALHVNLENNAEIKVAYDKSLYDINILKKRFGSDNVDDESSPTTIYVTHRMFGWSNDNRNVDNKILTSYSSQTTAHILDAIKSGNVQNVNEFTFQVYKTLVDIGSNYDTAVSFIMQPGIARLNREFNLTNSIYSQERGKNYVLKAVRNVLQELSIDYNITDDLETLLQHVNKTYGHVVATLFGDDFTELTTQDSINASFALDSRTNAIRLKEEGIFAKDSKIAKDLGVTADVIKTIYDLQMMVMFSKMNNLAQDIRVAAMLVNPDKFGAKQTMFETREVFQKLVDCIYDNRILASEDTEEYEDIFRLQVDGKNMLDAIYPGIYECDTADEALNHVLTSEDFIKNSKYKTLAAFLKYATATSMLVNKALFVTQQDEFIDAVNKGLRSIYPAGRILDKKTVRTFQNYIINSFVINSQFLQAPLHYNKEADKEKGIKKGFGYLDYEPTKENTYGFNHDEFIRCLGFAADPTFTINKPYESPDKKTYVAKVEVYFKDINNPTQEELNDFEKLSAAQKVEFVKTHFRNAGVFSALYTKLTFDRGDYMRRYGQHITFDEEIINLQTARLMFLQMFSHKNPILALTTADVIKYAFFKEGYRMGINNVSKIIPNELLLNGGRIYGTNIVNNTEDKMTHLSTYLNPVAIDRKVMNFVRSHSNTIGINVINVKKLRGKSFELHRMNDGIIQLPYREYDAGDVSLLSKYGIISEYTNTKQVNSYVRLKFDDETILYRIYENEDLRQVTKDGLNRQIFLIPLNLLEENEDTEISSNSANNVFGNYDTYKSIIDEYVQMLIDKHKDDLMSEKVLNNLFKRNDIQEKLKKTIFGVDLYKDSKELPELNGNPRFKLLLNEIENWYANLDLSKPKQLILRYDKLTDYIKGTKNSDARNAKITLSSGKQIRVTFKKYINTRLIKKYTGDNIDAEITDRDKVYNNYINLIRYFAELDPSGNNEYSYNSPIFSIELVDDKLIENDLTLRDLDLSELPDVAAQGTASIYRRGHNGDREAYYIAKEFRELNIPTSSKTISPYIEDTIPSISRYVERRANEIEQNVRFYLEDPETGDMMSIDNPKVIELIRHNPLLLNDYLKTIQEPQKLVDDFGLIRDLDIMSEDIEMQTYLDVIKKSVEKIQNLSIIDNAYRNYAELYLDKVTDNPLIKGEMLSVLSGFYKTNWFNANFNDIQETSNPLVQLTLKRFQSRLYARNMEAKRQVETFLNKMKEFKELAKQRGERFDYNDFIDDYGRFKLNSNAKFLEDRNEYQRKVEEAKRTFGENSVEYLKAKLEYNEWKVKHVEQPIVKEYYQRKNEILRIALYGGNEKNISEDDLDEMDMDVIPAIPKTLSTYLKLKQRLYSLRDKVVPAIHDEELTNEIQKVKEQINTIFDKNRENDNDAVNTVLNFYINEESKLNKEYFYRIEKENFQTTLNTMLKVVRSHELSGVPKSVYATDSDYIRAKNWISQNAIETVDYDKLPKELKLLYDDYVDEESQAKSERVIIPTFEKAFNTIRNARTYIYHTYRDEFGNFDPTRIPDDVIDKYKELLEKHRAITGINDFSDRILLSNTLDFYNKDNVVYTREFYEGIAGKSLEKGRLWRSLATEANKILGRFYRTDPRNGAKIIDLKLIEEEDIPDIKRLIEIYERLATIRNSKKSKTRSKFIKEKVKFDTNIEKYKEDLKYIDSLPNSHLKTVLSTLVKERGYKGRTEPRRFLYSVIRPKRAFREEFIDKEATKIKRFQEKFKIRTTREEYEEAKVNNSLNMSKEDYERWYYRNHIYNPYTGAYEALDIWYKVRWNPKEVPVIYKPLYNAQRTALKDGSLEGKDKKGKDVYRPDYRNKNYNPALGHEGNYIKGSNPLYDNNINLSKTEIEAMDYIQRTLIALAHTDAAVRYFTRGMLPARRKNGNINSKNWFKELVKVVGWESEAYDPSDWYEDVSYSKHKDPLMPMTEMLRGKINDNLASSDEEYLKKRTNETNEEWQKYLDERKENNRKIREKNREVHKQLLDRDWENVISDFIVKAGAYNAVLESQPELFYTKKMLEKYGHYVDSYNKKGQVIFKRDRRNTGEDETEYLRTPDKLLIEQYNNQLRRIIYNQWKAPNNPTLMKWMSTLQSLSSASFMMFNFKGGVANVTLGESQIFGEAKARTFFGIKHMTIAKGRYVSKIGDYIAHRNVDYSSSLEGAVIKHFDVIDYDEHTGVSRLTLNAKERLRRIRDYGYYPQTAGEHEMQNTALFAMLESHRLVDNSERHQKYGEPKYKFMNLQEYTYDLHEKSLLEILTPEQEKRYKQYKEDLKNDASRMKRIAWFQEDTATTFVMDYLRDLETKRKFVAQREANEKRARKEFEDDNLHPTIWSQLKLSKSGHLEFIKSDDSRGWLGNIDKPKEDGSPSDAYRLLGDFKGRVISVNKYIHGVYDKSGRAQIEKTFIGSLIMQYHKHLPIGFMKRYRVKGMYSEERGAVTKGMYSSLITYLTMPIHSMRNTLKLTKEEEENLVGIQNIFRDYVDFAIHYKLYYKLLPEYDRANIRRMCGDLIGVIAALCIAVGIRLAMDDDDEDSIAYNFLLYEADRLATEAAEYWPFMLPTEGKKLVQSPIAANSIITDGLGVIAQISKFLMNGGDYDMTYQSGKFAGENKIKVYLLRRIPIWRGIKTSFLDIADNNHYYKLGQNMLGFLDIESRVKDWKSGF